MRNASISAEVVKGHGSVMRFRGRDSRCLCARGLNFNGRPISKAVFYVFFRVGILNSQETYRVVALLFFCSCNIFAVGDAK